MSSRREEIEELLNVLFGDDDQGETSETHKFPTETKGFKSLVSPVEYKAVCDLCDAVEKFIDLHNEEAMKLLGEGTPKNDYSMFQYCMFSEQVGDLTKSIHLMKDIHNIDKDFVDVVAKDCADGSVKRLLHLTMMKGILNK